MPPWVEMLKYPPYSFYFLFILSLILNLVSSLVSKAKVDYEKLKRYNEERKKYFELKKRAAMGDKKSMIKAKKMEARINAINIEYQKMVMLPTLYTFVPFMLIFILLRRFYGENPVLKLPFKIPFESFLHKGSMLDPYTLGYIGCYFLVSISTSLIIQKILGISMTE